MGKSKRRRLNAKFAKKYATKFAKHRTTGEGEPTTPVEVNEEVVEQVITPVEVTQKEEVITEAPSIVAVKESDDFDFVEAYNSDSAISEPKSTTQTAKISPRIKSPDLKKSSAKRTTSKRTRKTTSKRKTAKSK